LIFCLFADLRKKHITWKISFMVKCIQATSNCTLI
jgi:hypothetical protein